MALYTLTFENTGGDTNQRKIAFDNDSDCNKFVDAYNLHNQDAKVIRVTKFVSEMSNSDRQKFKDRKTNTCNLESFKVFYEVLGAIKKAYIMSIPYLDKLTTNKKDIESFMMYVKDYKEVKKYTYKENY